MSVPAESKTPGVIPTFPFQEVPGAAGRAVPLGGGAEAGGKATPDFESLRLALEAAVRALRSFHEYVGVLEEAQRRRVEEEATVRPLSVPVPVTLPAVEAALPPREVFPSGQIEPWGGARAVLNQAQQAQLDAALAQAFATEPPVPSGGVVSAVAPPEPPAVVAPPVGAGQPAFVLPTFEPVVREATPAPVAVAGPAFALVSPAPTAPAFAAEAPGFEPALRGAPPQAHLAPAALVAAAPPLPGHFSPFAAAPAAPSAPAAVVVPVGLPLGTSAPGAVPSVAAAPVGMPAPPSAPVAAAGSGVSALPFSPFQGLEPAPQPPMADPGSRPAVAETGWPTSPFFGTTQAATAPFRMVEPPPVIASTKGCEPGPQAPSAPAAPPAAPQAPPVSVAPPPAPPVPAVSAAPSPIPNSPPVAPAPTPAAFPPVPDQGQVFNFAELLRANGQR